MLRKGNCLDNAMAENFFGIMKSELLYAEKFESAEGFIKALDDYTEYYNNKRNMHEAPSGIHEVSWKHTGGVLEACRKKAGKG